MTPISIIEVLTAATPIVASLASIANSNKPVDKNESKSNTEVCNIKEKQPRNINITINNHFYTNPSEKDVIICAEKNQEQIADLISSSENRYIL